MEIEARIEKEDLLGVFGPTLKYKNIYLGKMNGESVSVEEFVEGTFTKYINNDGLPCSNIEEDLHKKAECLSHYSYVHSKRQVMVVDIQGAGYMFDPEVVSLHCGLWRSWAMKILHFVLILIAFLFYSCFHCISK